MKIKNLLPKMVTVLFVIVALASCEEDFNDIGSNVIGNPLSESTLLPSDVISYSRKLTPVQSNNLSLYQFGVYNDPVYGKTTANILSQLVQNVPGTVFGEEAVVDSVVLYIPFLSTEMISGETSTFTLDSIYGDDPININVYESNYFLRDFDPSTGFQEPQKYYSDQGPLFERNLGQLIGTLENVTPNASPIIFNEGAENEFRQAPGIRRRLSEDFFQSKIIDMGGDPVLDNAANFKDYFRGVYLQAESVNEQGFLTLLNINRATITVFYKAPVVVGDEEVLQEREYVLTFAGNAVNVFENQLPQNVQAALTNPDVENGEENLYIKRDIVSIVEILQGDTDGDGITDLEELKMKDALITEASLKFYVNQDIVSGGSAEPERIFVYDVRNNTTLVDYLLDPTIANSNPLNAFTNHLGRLERGSDGNGEFYKVKITTHVSNIVNKDSTNVPLGVIVSQNATTGGFLDLLNNVPPGVTRVPVSSIYSPKGTVLYGNATTNADKRLQLEIFYIEPN